MITYQREINHCEVSPYVKEVTISEIKPALNSDNLDTVSFKEIGWNTIVTKGNYKVGDTVFFIPPESVLPLELTEKMGITKYTHKGKIHANILRGNRSEGLIVAKDLVEPYLPFIMKWEDPPNEAMRGQILSGSEVSPDIIKFISMPNILNTPTIFVPGEALVWSEKIHGTNSRIGKVPHPITEKNTLYIGGHRFIFKINEENRNNLYIKTMLRFQLDKRIPESYVFFGEIFGPGVQKKYTYNNKIELQFFACTKHGYYLSVKEFTDLCHTYMLPSVKFHTIQYEGTEQIRQLANLPSEITSNHIREGVVLCSLERVGVFAKCIGSNYYTGKKTTERH